MDMTISEISGYEPKDILPFYEGAGWTNYTARPEMIRAAHENSLLILGAYQENQLLGFIRAVGDGASVVLIQDIIVLPEHRRKGIGTALLRTMMDRYAAVYQMELMTDDRPDTVAFYESPGFKKTQDLGCCAFMKIKRPC